MTAKAKKFGTFLGVFTPSVLTILGLIMYLRFGWVVGNVGFGWTMVIVLLASSITFITGLSASAIATNMLVGVGGEYYMISRSLGLELGGAIGIPLYFCRTLSVTFYCFGLAETLTIFWSPEWGEMPAYMIQLVAAVIIVLITLLSGKSAELVLKAQIPILVLVGLSLVALFFGVFSGPLQAPSFESGYESAPEGFWYVFAVFFPAVTGFTAGIGMSGDLKDPKKSIPIGTIGAVLTCLLIYLLIPVALASTNQLSQEDLLDPYQGIENWITVAFLGSILILPAVLGAILSSAFGSILGGPRVLQALSTDGLAPKQFSKLSKSGQPTLATWVTGAIALVAVSLGELNTVARLVSVLFLTLYVAINLSAALEVLVGEPHFRPKIKVPWYVSILGALGAIFVMFLVSPIACLIAIIIEIGIYVLLRKRSLEQQWGDVTSGVWLNIAKRALLNHSKRKRDPRNWRPQILLFTRDVAERIETVKLMAALCQNKGILTISTLIPIREQHEFEQVEEKRSFMVDVLSRHGIEAFCEVSVVADLQAGAIDIAKGHGLAGLKSNTVAQGFSETEEGRVHQLESLIALALAGKSMMLIQHADRGDLPKKQVTIWWRGKEKNGDLMLLLAYLLQLDQDYSGHEIEIASVVRENEETHELESFIRHQLDQARIKAKVRIILSNQPVAEVIEAESNQSDVVFIGMAVPTEGYERETASWMNKVSSSLHTTIFVYNAGIGDAVPELLNQR